MTKKRTRITKREQQNLANLMGMWCIGLRLAIEQEDWEHVSQIREAINNESCNLSHMTMFGKD